MRRTPRGWTSPRSHTQPHQHGACTGYPVTALCSGVYPVDQRLDRRNGSVAPATGCGRIRGTSPAVPGMPAIPKRVRAVNRTRGDFGPDGANNNKRSCRHERLQRHVRITKSGTTGSISGNHPAVIGEAHVCQRVGSCLRSAIGTKIRYPAPRTFPGHDRQAHACDAPGVREQRSDQRSSTGTDGPELGKESSSLRLRPGSIITPTHRCFSSRP